MNKNAIQKFAIWARNELIAQVSQRAYQYGIDESGFGDASADTLNGRLLTAEEKSQRQELIKQIKEKGYKQVMEEVAYTWFNRFIALRFMEVNNYLPSHIRVFSDASGAFKPEILNDVLHLDLPGLSSGKVAEYIESNDTEALYRYLLLTQCNALNSALPVMFERMGGYTEMLLPNNILRQDSVLGHMVSDIPEEDWQDAVQIIGWLYQYYNTELKDDTFAQLKKNVKITKERIPAATQLFTPDWIVRYMVENSLGRLWLEHLKAEAEDGTLHIPAGVPIRQEGSTVYVDSASEQDAEDNFASYFKTNWKYYLDEAKQEPDVEARLREVRKSYKDLSLKEIKIIDPCMGSGHILVYAFDVLMQIYTSAGWDQREAAQSILKNNLFGLDIDDRAAQLAYFAVMMKARQYDRRLLTRGIQPNIHSIIESNALGGAYKQAMGDFLLSKEHQETLNHLLDAFIDAKEYGSILCLEKRDYVGLLRAWNLTASQTTENLNLTLWFAAVEHEIPKLIEQAIILTQGYDVVVTNPPYMAVSNAGAKVNDYVKKNFPDSKADLFAVFIERCGQMAKKNGYQAMITQHAWMFLSSFEKLRTKLLAVDIVNMAHLGARAFEEIGGEVVQTTSFVIRKSHIADYKGEYCRLIEPTSQQGKENMFLAGENRYTADQSNFSKIRGAPVAYWVSQKVFDLFGQDNFLDYFSFKRGVATGDNDRFLRMWYEVGKDKCSILGEQKNPKWFPYNKGGEYRKWFGNREYLVNWENDGAEIKNYTKNGRVASRPQNIAFNFCENISYSSLTSGSLSFRHYSGFINDQAGNYFIKVGNSSYLYGLGLLNSKIADFCIGIKNSTLNTTADDFAGIPICINHLSSDAVEHLVAECEDESKKDWDSYETSWDFKRNPLV